MLADPPKIHPQATDKWLEWRQEVRDGKRTFRFKEREGEYNFEGPVARPGAREERRPPPGGNDTGSGKAGSGGGGSSGKADGGGLVGRRGAWLALGVLVLAVVAYGVVRVRRGP